MTSPSTKSAWWTDTTARSRFRRSLLKWFDRHQRQLPWRQQKSPYRIWVSEIMLQQTQVATVINYFERFIKRFPNVRALAAAELQEVLKYWEGLGYYRRARQLHAAARMVVDQHGGRFPQTFDEVIALPGIGRYTAGAILSIAQDQRYPILEGNTERVFARLIQLGDDPKSKPGQHKLWELADKLVSRHRPGDVNQALMEIGSQLCHVNHPDCGECPVRRFCESFQSGRANELPRRSVAKTKYESVREAAIIIRRGDRVVLRHCQPGQRWADLWDFPRFAVPTSGHGQFLCKRVRQLTGLSVRLGPPVKQIRHAVTRFRITLDCYHATDVRGRLNNGSPDGIQWTRLNELGQRPLNVTGRKIANWILSQ